MDMDVNVRALAQYVSIISVFVACWRWGAGPERYCGSVMLAMLLGEVLYHVVFGPGYVVLHTDVGHLALSLGGAAALTWIALRANRRYPFWLASFQLVALLTHLVRDLAPGVGGAAYQIMVIAPSYFMIAMLIAGLIAHRRRLARFGPYRSWNISSPVPDRKNRRT